MLETLKRKAGLADGSDENTYECQECGERFTSTADPDSHWLRCRECESTDAELVSE
ncbi:MAG: hypothetical protein ABEJ85_04220 [Haloarculaceae archaeon]